MILGGLFPDFFSDVLHNLLQWPTCISIGFLKFRNRQFGYKIRNVFHSGI